MKNDIIIINLTTDLVSTNTKLKIKATGISPAICDVISSNGNKYTLSLDKGEKWFNKFLNCENKKIISLEDNLQYDILTIKKLIKK